MPDPAPCNARSCEPAPETPRTLSAQRALGPVTAREGDLETLALIGTQLSDAMITTNNGAALISGQGGYGAVQTTATPFSISPRRVTLRVAPHANLRLFTTYDDADRLSLIASTPSGDIVHRVTVQDTYDQRIIGALDPRDTAYTDLPAHPVQQTPSNVVPLNAVRAARQNWADTQTGHHLNDLLDDAGHTRARTLPYIGTNTAWRIVCQAIPGFLSYLADKSIPHAHLVPAQGLLQGNYACDESVTQAGQILLIRGPGRNFALDLGQVSAAWVTRFDTVSQVELYDAQHRAIAVIAAGDTHQIAQWNALLASLPPARVSPDLPEH